MAGTDVLVKRQWSNIPNMDSASAQDAFNEFFKQINNIVADLETLRVGVSEFFASETHDFASLVDGAGETGSIAVTGAALGDFVQVSFSLDLQDMILTAYVSAADTVEYRLQNESTATVNLASGTIRVRVVSAAAIAASALVASTLTTPESGD